MADDTKTILVQFNLQSEALQKQSDEYKKSIAILRAQIDGLNKLEGNNTKEIKAKQVELQKLNLLLSNNEKILKQVIIAENSENNSLQQKRAVQSALIQHRNTLNQADQKSIATVQNLTQASKKLTDEIKKQEQSYGTFSRNVGNYWNTIKEGATKYFGYLAAAMGSAVAAWKIYEKAMASTEASHDRFLAIMKGIEFSTRAFFKTIKDGDFGNLLGGLEEAYRKGKEYQEGLDLIDKRKRALDFLTAKEKIQASKYEEALKNKSLSANQRLEAGKKWMDLMSQSYERNKIQQEKNLEVQLKSLNIKGMDIEQTKKLLTYYYEQDALNPALREEAEKYNELIRERQKELKNVPKGGSGEFAEINKQRRKDLQLEINSMLQRNDQVGQYANLLRIIEEQSAGELLKNVNEAFIKSSESQYAFYAENKRIFSVMQSQQKEITKEAKEITDANMKYLAENTKLIEDYNAKILELGMTEKEKELDSIAKHHAELLSREKLTAQQIFDIRKGYAEEYAAWQKRWNEKEAEEREKANKERLKNEQETADRIADARQKEIDEAVRRRDIEIESEKQMWDAKVKVAMAGAEVLSSIQQLMRVSGAENTEFYKTLALAEIAISTGVAIAKGIEAIMSDKTTPSVVLKIAEALGIAGTIISSMASAINVVNSSNVPKASKGKLLQGASHANGGIPIEAEGGEAIINKKSTAKYLPLLSAINQSEGGVPFMQNGGIAQPIINNSFMANDIINAVKSMPAPVLGFKEFTRQYDRYIKLTENAKK